MNHMLRTVLLMTVMTVLVVAIGGSIAGQGGATLGVIIAIAMNLLSYWNSDTLVLAMTGARPFGAGDNPAIPQLVADLAQRAQIPTPKVYIVESAEPNAFATGRRGAVDDDPTGRA